MGAWILTVRVISDEKGDSVYTSISGPLYFPLSGFLTLGGEPFFVFFRISRDFLDKSIA